MNRIILFTVFSILTIQVMAHGIKILEYYNLLAYSLQHQ